MSNDNNGEMPPPWPAGIPPPPPPPLNEDQDIQQQQQLPPHVYPPLEDLDEWVRRNGLEYSEDTVGQGSVLNQQEAHERFDALRQYEVQVHERLFQKELQQEKILHQQKQVQLQTWEQNNVQLQVITTTTTTTTMSSSPAVLNDDNSNNNNHYIIRKEYRIPLHYLAAHSDTVYAMATTPDKNALSSLSSMDDSDNNDMDESWTKEENNHDEKLLTLTLEHYPDEAVQTFLKVIDVCSSRNSKCTTSSTAEEGKQQELDTEQDKTTTTTTTTATGEEDLFRTLIRQTVISEIPDHHIIDCCQMAHYLQCTSIVNAIVHACLIPSVDSANCLSLVQLADQLDLPDLMEASLSHMMASLTNLEQHEIWDDLSPELQQRIGMIRTLLQQQQQQQQHRRRRQQQQQPEGGGDGTTTTTNIQPPKQQVHAKLYFTSFQEYLAIFAEQVEYYRERLQDAKLGQQLHWNPTRGGGGGGGGGTSQQQQQQSPAWVYAQAKIDQHERRVQTLRNVLAQQKQLFGVSSSSSLSSS